MTVADIYTQTTGRFSRQRLMTAAIPLGVLAYLAYIFVAFDIGGLMGRLRVDNVMTLLSDTYSYKTHVTRDTRTGDVTVAIEGERRGTYAPGTEPSWVSTLDGVTTVGLDADNIVTFDADTTSWDIPGYGLLTATRSGREITLNRNPDTLPDWISYSSARVDVKTSAGRLSVTRNRTEVFRYAFGWELFWFTLDSPYYGHSLFALLFGPQLDPAQSNLVGMWDGFWGNAMWHHGEVAWALGETILMAFLGTFGAAIIAFPLGFLAARNFTPLAALRFSVRRVFDFVRGVDGLIWTILLSRAFGPGPLTGTLAILLTDTGTFGKIFSEALENVDNRQIEGVQSTGANVVQRYCFGVIPQVVPVLLSQVLYLLESNTRSATIIGAITGGGIGLLLTQAIITHKDWEEVSYYIVLIILMVMAMDWLSGVLRRRVISGRAV
ncbi:phosphonate ABC transporter, permease protein PhnE [Pseudoruegeria sp. SK021]|uniref:phosphonate ABC transporter, permease protein PhnE n=1 Tax=Pseudoruegeria sp. SK021 TaxID=1933035 RepID=UPI000A217713|nr:phosphonate ABC transporter, permease protein PhnE [Pseudoruegeria sp. SK021]OSP55934.1 phosphonate ABC transporter, permease protein PhnE [Pseudoruegeria sp. SK021]